jgi:hypothetical protein
VALFFSLAAFLHRKKSLFVPEVFKRRSLSHNGSGVGFPATILIVVSGAQVFGDCGL